MYLRILGTSNLVDRMGYSLNHGLDHIVAVASLSVEFCVLSLKEIELLWADNGVAFGEFQVELILQISVFCPRMELLGGKHTFLIRSDMVKKSFSRLCDQP